jgi:hypothetical protein
MTAWHKTWRPRSGTALRAEALLRRYPDLSERHLAELITLYPRLRLLDRGLIAADDRLASRLADFHRDHGSKLRASASLRVALVAVPAALAVAAQWWLLA